MLSLGGAAFVVGLSGAMSPGPFLTVTITRAMRHGRASALLMLVGHAAVEAALLVAFAFGLRAFIARPAVSLGLALAGGAFLVWMGGSLLLGAIRGTIHPDAQSENSARRLGPIAEGAVVSVSNPYWTLWWVTIGAKLAADGLALGPGGVVSFFLGHQLADVTWYVAVVLAVSSGKRLLTDSAYRTIIGACALFLLYLGASFLFGALT